MKLKLVLVSAAFALSNVLCAQDTISYKPVELPVGFTSQIDVVYTGGKGWNKKMDIYLPPAKGKSTPVIINIHGGGWNKGTKESQTGFNTFFKAGFAVANISYRLVHEGTAPAAIEDARCALIYLVKNAKALNIDVNRIVVMGGSAGGHLALMAGLLADNPIFDSNCKGEKNIKVAAIIDKYGITDVWDWGYGPVIKSKSARNWLGEKSNDEQFAKSVSPVTYVNKNSPPVFIVHGNADPVVPYEQSVLLKKKLDEAGVKNVFITVEGGEHGKFDKEKNSELNKKMIEFLKEISVI